MSAPPTSDAVRRARRWFWGLTAVAVLLTGGLSSALKSSPSPAAGATVAVLGLALAGVTLLAVRVLLAVTGRLTPDGRPRRRPR